jgi:hypothetical protein
MSLRWLGIYEKTLPSFCLGLGHDRRYGPRGRAFPVSTGQDADALEHVPGERCHGDGRAAFVDDSGQLDVILELEA